MLSKLKIALSTLVAGATVAALTAFATPAPAPAQTAAQAATPAARSGGSPAPAATVKKASNSTADHSKFKELQKDFKTGPEVTKACLTCHTEAAKQVHKTKHWTWEFMQPGHQAEAGQEDTSSTTSVPPCHRTRSSAPPATSATAGRTTSSTSPSEDNVDCLVCHDTTGTYRKAAGPGRSSGLQGHGVPAAFRQDRQGA